MKKRILIPGAAIGGIAVYLASQFLSLNLGDLSVPKETSMVSVKEQATSSNSSNISELRDGEPTQTVSEVPIEKTPEILLMVDIVIDGDQFIVNRLTNLVGEEPTVPRESVTLDRIIPMVQQAVGDKSGTRVRVSRTADAVASAETRLMEALAASGISVDEIDRRNRLIE